MDRFVVREPRNDADYPLGNQIMPFSANSGSSNMAQETIYFGGPLGSEFPSMGLNTVGNLQYLNAQHSMRAQLNAQHNTVSQQNAQHNTVAQQNAQHNSVTQQNAQHNTVAQQNAQRNTVAQAAQLGPSVQQGPNAQLGPNVKFGPNAQLRNAQRNSFVQQNMTAQHNMNRQIMNPHMAQQQGFSLNNVGQSQLSGIDPNYLAGYSDNNAQFIISGQQIQRNCNPINPSFGSDYQNRSFDAKDRNKQKYFSPQVIQTGSPSVQLTGQDDESKTVKSSVAQLKKPNELDLQRNDIQNQIATRADKLKALHKSGPRSFSGPVEKVLKWHKSLQDIGILIFYEIVAKCVSVRPGKSCSKNLVVRDDNGPAMQIVYYEIDFMLPELKLPCTIRIVGRMMAGTCRLQAFNVRPATGDDVATLPRRAAVAAHHVAKLCKEYGPNAPQI